MNSMNLREKIEKYIKENELDIHEESIWSFDESIEDELLHLIFQGIKTATASLYKFYELENEELPKVGNISIITNSKGDYQVLEETISVKVVPFKEVSSEHAYKEGEGDRTLEYWRKVHKDFFNNELKEINEILSEDDLVVLEEFRVLVGLEN